MDIRDINATTLKLKTHTRIMNKTVQIDLLKVTLFNVEYSKLKKNYYN